MAEIGLYVVFFLLGRAVQNWCSRSGEADRMAYRAGYADVLADREPKL